MTAGSIPLIGYTDRLSVRPGEKIAFKVSSQHDAPYQAQLVRIICADPNPDGPGMHEQNITNKINRTYPSRPQHFHPGSFAYAAVNDIFTMKKSFALVATILPTLPGAGKQGILCCHDIKSGGGVDLYLTEDGNVGASISSTDHEQRVCVQTGVALKTRNWYRVWASYDALSEVFSVGHIALHADKKIISARVVVTAHPMISRVNRVFIAALHNTDADADAEDYQLDFFYDVHHHFNGKIESPMIHNRALDEKTSPKNFLKNMSKNPLVHWDFSREISSNKIQDICPLQFHGIVINFPTRAMTGSNWCAREMCWRHAPKRYGAIHFHDDDIIDFNWETDFHFTIPNNFRSGVYAVRIRCGDDYDALPFFVCPPKNQSKDQYAQKLCVLISTFTYTVYGNHARPNFATSWLARMKSWGAYPWNPAMHREYGLSTYNDHRDGSGICHASHRRPLLTMRPGYLTFGDGDCSGLRHLQADSHLLAWLEQNNIEYDLITDQELHDEGVAAIANYPAVTTGSHPEYHTPQTLQALQAYRARGGNFMYLGGNGFYWKIALHPQAQEKGAENGAIEIRRAESGIRAWAAEPGEYYHAFDGGYGGLWRRNNQPPQKLVGVGFSAQGTFLGSYYRRRPETFSDPQIAWIFAGIQDEIIGDFGFSGGGAAGFELDRADFRLGSPDNLRVLASSENHPDTFVLVPEEQLTHITTWSGEPAADLIRADMIYQVNENGGELFSTGSITFCGSLLSNNGDNNISKLLLNVVRRFIHAA